MKNVLDDLEVGKYTRTLVEGAEERFDFNKRGKIEIQSEQIMFENVPIISPNGDILVE